jgi:hypothetical protein
MSVVMRILMSYFLPFPYPFLLLTLIPLSDGPKEWEPMNYCKGICLFCNGLELERGNGLDDEESKGQGQRSRRSYSLNGRLTSCLFPFLYFSQSL